LASAGLADAHLLLGLYGVQPVTEALPQAKAAAEQALAIDDRLAEATTSLAFVTLAYDWDWSAAERAFQRALDLNPNYSTAHHWYAYHLVTLGRLDEAIAAMKRAQELDPLSLIMMTDLGELYVYARQYDKAIEQYRQVLELDPHFAMAHASLGGAYLQRGMVAEAMAAFQTAGQLSGDDPWIRVAFGHADGVLGKRAEAMAILDELRARSKKEYVSPLYIAWIYIGLGEKDRAFEWLEKAYEERAFGLLFLKVGPGYNSLRSDPRFADLVRRIGLAP